jgi:hypothetical protein
MIGLVEILFDRVGLRLKGRVCDVYLLCVTDTLVRYRFYRSEEPRLRDGILFVNAAGVTPGIGDEPESLILAQSERWRHA